MKIAESLRKLADYLDGVIPERFDTLENRVFLKKNDKIFIGQNQISDELHNLLHRQAIDFQHTDLYDILHQTTVKEARDMAILRAKNYEESRDAQMLYHWHTFTKNIIDNLANK